MRVIFLDFDGVLNSYAPRPKVAPYVVNGLIGLYPEKIEILNKIIAETKASIVVSSAWRVGKSIDDLRTVLADAGFKYPQLIIGKTGQHYNKDFLHLARGLQISDWLADGESFYDIKVDEFIVIDDESPGLTEFGELFFQINGQIGLTLEDAEKIIKRLNG